jgi:hypothetical protein
MANNPCLPAVDGSHSSVCSFEALHPQTSSVLQTPRQTAAATPLATTETSPKAASGCSETVSGERPRSLFNAFAANGVLTTASDEGTRSSHLHRAPATAASTTAGSKRRAEDTFAKPSPPLRPQQRQLQPAPSGAFTMRYAASPVSTPALPQPASTLAQLPAFERGLIPPLRQSPRCCTAPSELRADKPRLSGDRSVARSTCFRGEASRSASSGDSGATGFDSSSASSLSRSRPYGSALLPCATLPPAVHDSSSTSSVPLSPRGSSRGTARILYHGPPLTPANWTAAAPPVSQHLLWGPGGTALNNHFPQGASNSQKDSGAYSVSNDCGNWRHDGAAAAEAWLQNPGAGTGRRRSASAAAHASAGSHPVLWCAGREDEGRRRQIGLLPPEEGPERGSESGCLRGGYASVPWAPADNAEVAATLEELSPTLRSPPWQHHQHQQQQPPPPLDPWDVPGSPWADLQGCTQAKAALQASQ